MALTIQYLLCKLYHVERQYDAIAKEIESLGLNERQEEMQKLEKAIQQEKKKHGQLLKTLLKSEKQMRSKEAAIQDLVHSIQNTHA